MSSQGNQPLVSIGVPAFNGEAFLPRALDSILAQAYDNLEIVICDDASTDRTEEVCRRYQRADSRIRYHKNASPMGRIRHYWKTFELCSGEFFMWGDQWDEKPPGVVEQCVAALMSNPNAVLAYGPVLERVPNFDHLVEIIHHMPMQGLKAEQRIGILARELRSIMIMYGLFRRAALQKAVCAEHYAPDVLLLLQVCSLGPFVPISAPIVIFKTRQGYPSHIMYQEAQLTVWNILTARRHIREKCWAVLMWGMWYLGRLPGLRFGEKVRIILSYAVNFGRRFRTRLAKELVFQLFFPLAQLSSLVWHVGKNVPGLPPIIGRLHRFR